MFDTTISRRLERAAASLIAFGLVSAAAPALAQEVHRYGDQSTESESGGGGGQSGNRRVYPGQPMPQSNDQSQQRKRRERRGSGEQSKQQQQVTGSYEIQIHEPDKQMERGRLRERTLLNKAAEKMYQGIIPGKRDRVDHLGDEESDQSTASGSNKLTWIGFQPEEERTRVFLQTSRRPEYSVRTENDGRRVVLTLERTEFSAKNFRRHIDTSYFDRVVERIETKATGDATIEVWVSLDSETTHSVETKQNYLYIDFPHQSDDGDESSDSDEQ